MQAILKKIVVLATLFACLFAATNCHVSSIGKSASASLIAVGGQTPKDVYKLATDAKKPTDAPAVTFNHLNHSTKNYSIDGTKPIACIECHHTEQPASEVVKHPPLKTAYPADRTTTLTTELLKDATAPEVQTCRACHAQEGAKPKLLAEIPKVTYEGDTDPTVLTNEEAYHRNCNTCHDLVADKRKGLKIPTSQQCAECHTGK